MEIKQIVEEILKQNNIHISADNNPDGLRIKLDREDLVIKGSSNDLLELANYLINMALSNIKGNHLHIDDLTLLSSSSEIKSLIIEKVQRDNKEGK